MEFPNNEEKLRYKKDGPVNPEVTKSFCLLILCISVFGRESIKKEANKCELALLLASRLRILLL